ncbi:hypothetical protein KEM55_007568, partial [Ascosphaera atra]
MASDTSPKPSSTAEKRRLEAEEDPKSPKPSPANATTAKRARVMGPTLPPGFQQQPEQVEPESPGSQSDDESSDDDDYGPSLPPPAGATSDAGATTAQQQQQDEDDDAASKPLQRDEWMLRPPDSSDWSSRVDPTKLRNRKFNMSRAPVSRGSGPSSTWTETAEEKKKRLESEVMGFKAPAHAGVDEGVREELSEADLKKKKMVEEYNAQKRNSTLYSKHQKEREAKEKEEDDDPSSRPFDREKDIRGPTKVSNAQRREFLNKAQDFGSKFSG